MRLLPIALVAAAALPLAAQEAAPVRDLSEVDTPPAVQNVDALREALAAGYPAYDDDGDPLPAGESE